MIAEIKFKNMFSFRDETVLSFEADKSKDLESYHVVELAPDVKLLKLAVIYGANASGKSNIIKVCDFIRSFITCTPLNKAELIKIVPFLLNRTSKEQASEFSVSFYAMNGDKAIRYVYSVLLETTHIVRETLIYYLSQQPATVFERSMENNVSSIKFGQKVKMSVFAAYMQVNTNIAEMETALQYLTKQMMPAIVPTSSLSRYAEEAIKKETAKEYILRYLQEADFNISNISSKEQETKKGVVNYTMYQHKVSSGLGGNDYYEFPELYESDGTIRTFGLASQIQNSIGSNAFLAVDEIESSLHPKLIEYMIERFLKESKQAQLLLTTHYDGLLGEEDLLRKDNIWFAEKNTDGASVLYPLTDFKGLNRISSLQKAYKFGKFGAVPNL